MLTTHLVKSHSQEAADPCGQTSLSSVPWLEKDVLLNCLEWSPEIFADVHADTVYRWKLDGPGSGGGKPKKISGTVAE